MACFFGHKCDKVHIPRKLKNKLKSVLVLVGKNLLGREYYSEICTIQSSIKKITPLLSKHKYLVKYIKQIDLLIKHAWDYDGNEPRIDEKGDLVWLWEDDGDYGGTSGHMKTCYTKEAAGKTWAYSALSDVFESMYSMELPACIKSDNDLLKYIKTYPPYSIN
jgi:hypothetical protein